MPSQKELNRIFLSAFTDGMTRAGLFVRLRMPGAALDPNDSQFIEMFAQEKDPVAAIHAYEEGRRLSYRYAMAGLTTGTAAFLSALGIFTFLATRAAGH
ncbi:hypothetical protein [Tunturiibacter gelidiferens]|uniref:hypothetical protein n=1 Tax=Tunturiibacter gelidiferens TaxID=3069689 RepID=UPI003D9B9369